ncbi:MAG TPA: RnfABCDGE type electron transport complex subunit D [Spongiibacteraceae bacterium]|nr:RnfABCDGE type electron transport complex subunit D [Spongiibacteraceae bacterium]
MTTLTDTKATTRAMLQVLAAMAPGALASVWFFGIGVLTNLLIALIACAGFESLALHLRKQNVRAGLGDCSAFITGSIIALALPPIIPLWLLITACGVAILLAKHASGGFGRNVFNPAMAGYAYALIIFPAAFTHWPQMLSGSVDGVTGATALDVFKQNRADLVSDWWRAHAAFGHFGGAGWEWINLLFLAGGIYLLRQKIIQWYAPVNALLAIVALSLMFYDGGSSSSGGSPLMHLLSGGTLLGIFFVVTEPVTLPSSKCAQTAYGALIGTLIFCIRHWGGYADGIAFAVLFGNAAAPLLDRLCAADFFERLHQQ